MIATLLHWLIILKNFIIGIIIFKLIRFILRTFILIRRGYFYVWDYDNESLLFLGSKKRWKIPKLCSGYVKFSIFERKDAPNANKIFDYDDKGKTERGYVDNPDEKTKLDKVWVRVWLYEGDKELSEKLERIGYVDSAGDVYATDEDGNNPSFVGVVANNNKRVTTGGNRWWKTLFLWHHLDVFTPEMLVDYSPGKKPGETKKIVLTEEAQRCTPFGIGCVSETGRFLKFTNDSPTQKSHTLLARAAAALLLYKEHATYLSDEDKGERHKWWDTALIAAFSWIALFILYWYLLKGHGMVLFPWMGTEISLVVSLYLSYILVWLIWHEVKLANLRSSSSKRLLHFLTLFNRNTGIRVYDYFIIFVSIAGIILSFLYAAYPFIAIFAVILTGVGVIEANFSGEKWQVVDPYDTSTYEPYNNKRIVHKDNDNNEGKANANHDDKHNTPIKYNWNLNMPNSIKSFSITITFNTQDIEEKRAINPFKTNNDNARINYLGTVYNLIMEGDFYIDEAVKQIRQIARENKFTQIEEVKLILSFVQGSIEYKLDEESDVIGRIDEYCRFPVETLFDKEGDCDCKSALAASLFNSAGYPTLYVFTSDVKHAYVAISLKEGMELPCDDSDLIRFGVIKYNHKNYYVCETTSTGHEFGEIASNKIQEDLIKNNFSFVEIKQILGGA